MARPDDDHEPRAILGDDGEVLAVAHVSPDISPEGEAALRDLVEAVRRMHERLPAEKRAERIQRAAEAGKQAAQIALTKALSEGSDRNG